MSAYHIHDLLLECRNELTDDEKKTLLLALLYRDVRRDDHERGYRLFAKLDVSGLRGHPIFKTFNTVRKWMEAMGCKIDRRSYNWTAYVKFVFRRLAPTVPQPGQLKNRRLLVDFLNESNETVYELSEIERAKMAKLYGRILSPRAMAILNPTK